MVCKCLRCWIQRKWWWLSIFSVHWQSEPLTGTEGDMQNQTPLLQGPHFYFTVKWTRKICSCTEVFPNYGNKYNTDLTKHNKEPERMMNSDWKRNRLVCYLYLYLNIVSWFKDLWREVMSLVLLYSFPNTLTDTCCITIVDFFFSFF